MDHHRHRVCDADGIGQLHERALGEIWVAAGPEELCGYLIAVCVLSVEHQGLMAEATLDATTISRVLIDNGVPLVKQGSAQAAARCPPARAPR